MHVCCYSSKSLSHTHAYTHTRARESISLGISSGSSGGRVKSQGLMSPLLLQPDFSWGVYCPLLAPRAPLLVRVPHSHVDFHSESWPWPILYQLEPIAHTASFTFFYVVVWSGRHRPARVPCDSSLILLSGLVCMAGGLENRGGRNRSFLKSCFKARQYL